PEMPAVRPGVPARRRVRRRRQDADILPAREGAGCIPPTPAAARKPAPASASAPKKPAPPAPAPDPTGVSFADLPTEGTSGPDKPAPIPAVESTGMSEPVAADKLPHTLVASQPVVAPKSAPPTPDTDATAVFVDPDADPELTTASTPGAAPAALE